MERNVAGRERERMKENALVQEENEMRKEEEVVRRMQMITLCIT